MQSFSGSVPIYFRKHTAPTSSTVLPTALSSNKPPLIQSGQSNISGVGEIIDENNKRLTRELEDIIRDVFKDANLN